MSKVPSPCIDVCKFVRAGHCLGCSMTKGQKKLFKSLRSNKHREAFLTMLVSQQCQMGKYRAWAPAYERKCSKKDAKVKVPLSA